MFTEDQAARIREAVTSLCGPASADLILADLGIETPEPGVGFIEFTAVMQVASTIISEDGVSVATALHATLDGMSLAEGRGAYVYKLSAITEEKFEKGADAYRASNFKNALR